MTEQIKLVAERIKGLREISGISVETLASETGVSKEKYIEYESGKIDIPISFLYQIASKFNIELSELLSGVNPRLNVYCVVRKGRGLSVERRKQYGYENIAYNFKNKKAEPFLVTVEPTTDNAALNFNSHPGQEFNYVVEGSMMVVIDDHEIVLNEGDSLYFDSGHNHAMKALNDKTAKFLAIILK